MTPLQITEARHTLGQMWGLNRSLRKSELGRAVGLAGSDPGQSIRDYEAGVTPPSKMFVNLVTLYLRGALPPDGLDVIKA